MPRFIDDADTTDTGNGTPPIADMGAFEFFVGCPNTCGDIDGSGGNIDLVDFASFAVCFGGCYAQDDPCIEANFDESSDGCVGSGDFAVLAGCFGLSCDECSNCMGP